MVSIVTFGNEKKACLVEIGDTVDIRTNILLNIVKAAPCKLCFLFLGFFFGRKMLPERTFIPGLSHIKCESWSCFLRSSTTIPSFDTGGNRGPEKLRHLLDDLPGANWQVWGSRPISKPTRLSLHLSSHNS